MKHFLKITTSIVLLSCFSFLFAQNNVGKKVISKSERKAIENTDKTLTSTQNLLSYELREDLSRINKGSRCNYLHENLDLPKQSPSGAKYSYKVSGRGIDKTGKVKLLKKIQRAFITITLKSENVRVDTVLSIKIAPDDNKSAYLFAHFCSNSVDGQQLRYAISSKEKPLNFNTLLDGKPVVSGDTIATTKCIRDPHILRGNDGYFYMAMTDMDCNLGWWSNYAIVLMKSRNLMNWQHVTVNFKTKYPEWQMNGGTAVWAPQTIWDPAYKNTDGSKGRYMLYYGLHSSGKNTIHTYYSYVNDDFTDLLGTPKELMSNGTQNEDHIDADCIWSENDSLYHMFYTHRGIKKKVITSLTDNNWTSINNGNSYNENFGEGSTICRFINSNSYLMLFDDQAGVYYYSTSDDNMNTFKKFALLDKTHLNPRHGTVLTLNSEEEELLYKWEKLDQLILKLSANPDKISRDLKLAIASSKSILKTGWNCSISSLSKALDKSIKLLEQFNSASK